MGTHLESSTAAKAGYRRGTVLGLTVAEIFILLLFLLMLAFLVLAQEWRQQQDRQAEAEAQLEEVLPDFLDNPEDWMSALEPFETPEDIQTLRRQKDAADRHAETLQHALEEAERRRDEALKQAEDAKQHAEDIRRELLVLREKGHNPPCWYAKVPDGDGEREKAYYTFDVAVFDDHMVVRRLAPPLGGAEDDRGGPDDTYAAEAAGLPFDRIRYDTPLSDEDVISDLRPIHDAGKGARVRSYSCIFWIRVWDQTADDAKARWRQAHERVLQSLFGTFSGPHGSSWRESQ